MHFDLNREFDPSRSQGLSGRERRMGFDHMGDPDYFDGYVYVPMERRGRRPAAVTLRDADLKFLGTVTLKQGACAPWVAVSPVDRRLYSSSYGVVSAVVRYPRSVSGDTLSLGPPESVPLFDEGGVPVALHEVQGGAFSPDGSLYLVTREGIETFDVVGGRRRARLKIAHHRRWAFGQNLGDELEGIEVLDFDLGFVASPRVSGQIHVVMIDNDGLGGADDLYFKHFRINGPTR
jgi:hypothetical protein